MTEQEIREIIFANDLTKEERLEAIHQKHKQALEDRDKENLERMHDMLIDARIEELNWAIDLECMQGRPISFLMTRIAELKKELQRGKENS